jgi:septal ring factor EnvC (AmiA/AmiB activator)
MGKALARLQEVRAERAAATQQAEDAIETLRAARIEATGLLAERRAATAEARAEAASLRQRLEQAAKAAEDLTALSQNLAAPTLSAGPQTDFAFAAPIAPTAIPFSEAQAQATPPVGGSLYRRFGERAADGRTLKGVLIETVANAYVIAPWTGTIRYAGPFLHYRNIVILEPQDGYLIVLAGLHRIDREIGETVLAGEPLGVLAGAAPTVGSLSGDKPGRDTGAAVVESGADGVGGASGTGGRVGQTLYMEVRRGGRPVDPAPWFEFSGKEVSRL